MSFNIKLVYCMENLKIHIQCRKLNMLIEKSLNKKWTLKETSNTEMNQLSLEALS